MRFVEFMRVKLAENGRKWAPYDWGTVRVNVDLVTTISPAEVTTDRRYLFNEITAIMVGGEAVIVRGTLDEIQMIIENA